MPELSDELLVSLVKKAMGRSGWVFNGTDADLLESENPRVVAARREAEYYFYDVAESLLAPTRELSNAAKLAHVAKPGEAVIAVWRVKEAILDCINEAETTFQSIEPTLEQIGEHHAQMDIIGKLSDELDADYEAAESSAPAATSVSGGAAEWLPIFPGADLPPLGERVLLLNNYGIVKLAPRWGKLALDVDEPYWQLENEEWAFSNFTHYLRVPAYPSTEATINRATLTASPTSVTSPQNEAAHHYADLFSEAGGSLLRARNLLRDASSRLSEFIAGAGDRHATDALLEAIAITLDAPLPWSEEAASVTSPQNMPVGHDAPAIIGEPDAVKAFAEYLRTSGQIDINYYIAPSIWEAMTPNGRADLLAALIALNSQPAASVTSPQNPWGDEPWVDWFERQCQKAANLESRARLAEGIINRAQKQLTRSFDIGEVPDADVRAFGSVLEASIDAAWKSEAASVTSPVEPASETADYHSTELSDISSIITWLHAQNKPMGELLRRFYNDATRGKLIKEVNALAAPADEAR